MKKSFSEASELDGYEDLKPEDQAKVDKAWEDGEVADEDIPPSARKEKNDDSTEEKAPKKRGKKVWLENHRRSLELPLTTNAWLLGNRRWWGRKA